LFSGEPYHGGYGDHAAAGQGVWAARRRGRWLSAGSGGYAYRRSKSAALLLGLVPGGARSADAVIEGGKLTASVSAFQKDALAFLAVSYQLWYI